MCATREDEGGRDEPEQTNELYEPLRRVGWKEGQLCGRHNTGCVAWLRTHRVGLVLSLLVNGVNRDFIGYVVYKQGNFADSIVSYLRDAFVACDLL